MISNCDITIYNRVYDKAQRLYTYKRTVVEGCWWFGQQHVSVDSDGVHGADTYTVRIPNTEGYVPPESYTGEGWTITEDDYIVRGITKTEITKPAELEKERRKVMKVTGWNDDRFGTVPHIKVTGV